MKSKLFKQPKKDVAELQNQDESDVDIEIESSKPKVSNAKTSAIKTFVLIAILIAGVIYFFFFKGDNTSPKNEKLEEVTAQPEVKITNSPSTQPTPASNAKDIINDLKSEELDALTVPKLPELPKLPEIPKDVSLNKNLLPTLLDVEKQNQASATIQNNLTQKIEKIPEEPKDPRRSEIVVETGSGASSVAKDKFSGGINVLNEDSINKLDKTKASIVPTLISDKTSMIAQGKMMTAVLETAVNTEMPGSIRGIISRDVYAEAGSNVLIPKGSRLYGNYSTKLVRGQARVEINWTRLIRPDGVDLQIAFVGADQFGRSGIEGDLDNRYGAILSSSLLTSVLAVGGAIMAEKLSGNSTSSSTTNASAGTTTTTGSPSAQVIVDVSKTLVDTIGQIAGNAIDARPVIRIAQGTKITIVVNQDMQIPHLRE